MAGSTSSGVDVGKIEFNTQQACEQARDFINNRYSKNIQTAICIEDEVDLKNIRVFKQIN